MSLFYSSAALSKLLQVRWYESLCCSTKGFMRQHFVHQLVGLVSAAIIMNGLALTGLPAWLGTVPEVGVATWHLLCLSSNYLFGA